MITTTARGQRLRALAILLIAIATTGAAHDAMNFTSASEPERIAVPQPRFARLMTLGFDAVIADYYWMRAVQVAGGHENDSDGETTAELLEAIVAINPWVDHPYRFAAVWRSRSSSWGWIRARLRSGSRRNDRRSP